MCESAFRCRNRNPEHSLLSEKRKSIRNNARRTLVFCGFAVNETYKSVRVGIHFSDVFLIKNVLKQSPLLFNFSLECAIR